MGACGPALVLTCLVAIWGLFEQGSRLFTPFLFLIQGLPDELKDGPRGYRTPLWTMAFRLFFDVQLAVSMVLVLLVGPDLISQDLRFNAIPLYLSRPLRRFEYFLGKLGVIAVFLSAVTIAPALLAFALGYGFSLDPTVIRDTARLLLASVAFGIIVVVFGGPVHAGAFVVIAEFAIRRRDVDGVLDGQQHHRRSAGSDGEGRMVSAGFLYQQPAAGPRCAVRCRDGLGQDHERLRGWSSRWRDPRHGPVRTAAEAPVSGRATDVRSPLGRRGGYARRATENTAANGAGHLPLAMVGRGPHGPGGGLRRHPHDAHPQPRSAPLREIRSDSRFQIQHPKFKIKY